MWSRLRLKIVVRANEIELLLEVRAQGHIQGRNRNGHVCCAQSLHLNKAPRIFFLLLQHQLLVFNGEYSLRDHLVCDRDV